MNNTTPVFALAEGDDDLTGLLGQVLSSNSSAQAKYRLEKTLGGGGMGVAMLARRVDGGSESRAVVKILRPSVAYATPQLGATIVQKEVAAFTQLGQRVPPTPFVVRLIDAGTLQVAQSGMLILLPWLVIEYVHGGVEGTTLTERVETSIKATHYAFEPERALRAIDCLAGGLTAVHELGIIHRDIKPDNILCCGFDETELFKITDFGIARPPGLVATFGGLPIGTAGYAAPEQLGNKPVGPWTDVFAMAALVYQVLTGEDYFDTNNLVIALQAIASPKRRSLLDSPTLAPELRGRPDACREIDAVLARATSARAEERPQTARRLAAELAPSLRVESRRSPTSRRTVAVLHSFEDVDDDATILAKREWLVRYPPGDDRIVRQAAWSSDGTALATTTEGMSLWDGTHWRDIPLPNTVNRAGLHVVSMMGPERWLLAGDQGFIGYLEGGNVTTAADLGADVSITLASGDIDDLAVFVTQSAGGAPVLHSMTRRRWVRPVPLDGVSYVSSLARLSDSRWIVTGRSVHGLGFAAVYDPLMVAAHPLDVPHTAAFLSASAHYARGAGLMAGTSGVVAWFENERVSFEQISAPDPVSAVALDVGLRAWASTPGKVWCRESSARPGWNLSWSSPAWSTPFVSMSADIGRVLAMGADGAILEGRMRISLAPQLG